MTHKIRYYWIIFSYLSLFCLTTQCFADKAMAQVILSGKAELKAKIVQQGERNVLEKYYWVEVSLTNDGDQNLFVEPGNFTIADSLETYRSILLPDIPSKLLLKSALVQPRDTIRGILGFQFSSNETFPKNLLYETDSTIAFGKVTLVTQPAQPGERGETPHGSSYTPTPTPAPIHELSPQQVETQWIGTKAAKEATVARDSVVGELEMDIVNKYIRLQDNNKSDFDNKKISFDQFMSTKDNLDKQKANEIVSAHDKGQAVFNDTYSRITADYYHQKK